MRSRHFGVLTYREYAPRVKHKGNAFQDVVSKDALLDELF